MDMNMENGEAARFETEYEARLEADADAALDRLERGQTWLDWRKIGELLIHGRKLAMLHGHANKPEGKGYNLCMSAWLKDHPKLAKIDAATRSHAMQCLDQIEDIETWRATLGENQRQTINHPTTVLRRFKSATRAGETKEPVEKKPTERESLREANATLEGEVAKLKRRIEQSGENLFSMSDTPSDIAMAIAGNCSVSKLGDISKAILAELSRKRKAEAEKKRGGPRA